MLFMRDETKKVTIKGKTYGLLFTVDVYDEVIQHYGKFATMIDKFDTPGKAGRAEYGWAFCAMANKQKNENEPEIIAEDILRGMTPHDYSLLRDATLDAINYGMLGEIKEEETESEEEDLVLSKIKKDESLAADTSEN